MSFGLGEFIGMKKSCAKCHHGPEYHHDSKKKRTAAGKCHKPGCKCNSFEQEIVDKKGKKVENLNDTIKRKLARQERKRSNK